MKYIYEKINYSDNYNDFIIKVNTNNKILTMIKKIIQCRRTFISNNSMKQIIYIHGWQISKNKKEYHGYLAKQQYNPRDKENISRKDTLAEKLGKKYHVCLPQMPCKLNATYKERKIRFEKIIKHPETKNNLILIGNSLWAIFLIKRLSKHTSPKSIKQLHLVAPARDSKKHELYTFASKKKDIKHITQQTKHIHIYHSKDDTVCEYADSELIHSLLPWSTLHTFHDRWHFRQETFPELLENITHDKN